MDASDLNVQSLLLAGKFVFNQWQPSTGEGEVANFFEFFKKTPCTSFNLVVFVFVVLSLLTCARLQTSLRQ